MFAIVSLFCFKFVEERDYLFEIGKNLRNLDFFLLHLV